MQAVGLSSRVARLGPSPTLAISAKARSMRASGIDVVNLAAGEPYETTPEPIRNAAIRSIENGETKYTNTAGIPELRSKIAEKLAVENGVRVEPDQIVVSCGAKHCLFNAAMALFEPGDEVILVPPCWPTYADQARLFGATPVEVPARFDAGYQPEVEAIRGAVTSRTKAIVINSPCNPSGAVFADSTMKDIARIADHHGFWIISDEIYEKLIYEGRHISPASLGHSILEKTITVNGCSKSYAMTGWRIGYSASPRPVAQAMANLQDQMTSNPATVSQWAALEALSLPHETLDEMREEYRARRDLIVAGLRGIEGVRTHVPSGAFYAFADVSAIVPTRFASDCALAEFLLETAHVATVPGTAFSSPGHLRLSYAASREQIEQGVNRIGEALA